VPCAYQLSREAHNACLLAGPPLARYRGCSAVPIARAPQADPQAVAEPLAGPRVLDAIREHYSAAGPEASRPSMSVADLRALRQARPCSAARAHLTAEKLAHTNCHLPFEAGVAGLMTQCCQCGRALRASGPRGYQLCHGRAALARRV